LRVGTATVGRLSAWVVSGAVVAAATVCAYFRIFSQFALYDDEGYIIQSIRSYLQGGRLFDDVFTQYGPAFYVAESFLHGTLRLPLTHDVERTLTIGVWVGAGACAGTATMRLTRSWIIGLCTFVGVFIHLTPIINEPAHPQGLLALASAAVVMLSTWVDGERHGRLATAAIGALTAFAVLVKVNVGAFVAVGVALPLLFSAQLPRSRGTTVARVAAGVAACALPFLVVKPHLATWAFNYGVAVSLSVAGALIALATVERPSLPVRMVTIYVGTAAATAAGFLLVVILRGTTVPALVNGILVRPSQFADLFNMAFLWPNRGVTEALVSVGIASGYAVAARRGLSAPGPALAVLRLAVAGFGFWLPHTGYGALASYFTPLLWVLILPVRGEAGAAAFGRQVLATTAVLQSLQAYPVAGSQVAFASFLMVAALFVLVGDAFRDLDGWLGRRRLVSASCQAAVAAGTFWLYRPLLDLEPWRALFAIRYELRLPGAELLRVPPDNVAEYQWLTANISARCGSLLTMPGLYSLNAWSRVGPPSGRNVTAWTTLLTDSEQAEVWRSVDRAPQPCAVANPALARNWLGPRTLDSLPAVAQLRQRFREVGSAGNYTLLTRPGDAQPPAVLMPLAVGRQGFERGRTPLPVMATFLLEPRTSTIRLWIRSRFTGVILGCQSREPSGAPLQRWLPMFYIANDGRLFGQHWTAGFTAQATGRAVNDGGWHHVALVRHEGDERLYLDGSLVAETTAGIDSGGMPWCQLGTGATSQWPEMQRRWTPYRGEVEGLGVATTAWSGAEVSADWRRTTPRE